MKENCYSNTHYILGNNIKFDQLHELLMPAAT